MPKVEIHLSVTVALDWLDVNRAIALFQEMQAQVGCALATSYLEAIQDATLDEVLGPKWEDVPQSEAPWTCPQCESTAGFKRRGSRRRKLRKSSLGPIPFELRQVTCRRCHSTFAPFAGWLGLEPYQVSSSEFQAKVVETACQVSYGRSVAMVDDLARVQVSATAAHRWVQERGKSVKLDAGRADGRPLLLDATRVHAGTNPRGCNLNLGISLAGRRWVGGRAQMEIHPVCLGVDETWSETGEALAACSPGRVVYDGDPDVVQWIEKTFREVPQQRCSWHLVHELGRHLWEDGLKQAQARTWVNQVRQILYQPEYSLSQRRAALHALIQQVRDRGFTHAVHYLEGAESHLFAYREQPDGMFFDQQRQEPLAISSTSPVERQMREINRRTDVGARWQPAGVTNLLRLDLIRRFDMQQWDLLWDLPRSGHDESLTANLQVSVSVRPSPNVNTS